MLKDIPQERLLLYLCGLALVPLLLSLILTWSSLSEVAAVDSDLEWLEDNALSIAREEAPNEALASNYAGADRFYLVKHLESLELLQDEVQMLQQTLENQGIASQDIIEKRLNFLLHENHILLSEGSRQNYPSFQEVTEGFQKPVEVNISDLKHILSLIEGVALTDRDLPDGAPQLIITDFRLEKKKGSANQENLQLNLKLVKREFS